MLGQICCDSNGKLNAQSVLLEAGPDQGGQQVPVSLSELKEYSLFPGQVSKKKPVLCYNVSLSSCFIQQRCFSHQMP